jgi:chorismate mutase / prephenate dehydrogenase
MTFRGVTGSDSKPGLNKAGTGKSQGNAPEELERLRRDLDAIDEQIVGLLGARHRKVQEVVALKKARRLPVYHPAREEDLISQRREQAGRAGLDADHVEELYRCILRQSRVRQTDQVSRTGVRPGAKVLIVGGRGKMGRYFGRWLAGAAYEVRILDLEDWPEVDRLCTGIDLALVSVPIDRTAQVIRDLGPHLPPACVLTDITSVKDAPLQAMLSAHCGPAVGLHPLFGPTTSTMDQQIVVVAAGRAPEACQWWIDQLGSWGCIMLPLRASEHDELMSIVQALRHFATFVFGDFLFRKNVDVARTLELSSPIYRLELGMVGRLFAQDPALYSEIIFASPERRALLKEYVDALGRYRELLETGDKASFCAEFRRIAAWFGPFTGQALRESNFLIDKLVERF